VGSSGQAAVRLEAQVLNPWVCNYIFGWSLGNVRCKKCGQHTETAHRVERKYGAGFEVEFRCPACCETHGHLPALPDRDVKTIEGEQESLWES